MSRVVRFADLVEMIDRLPFEQREGLAEVLRRRVADERRRRIITSVRSARREHARGRTKPTTPEQLMREIRA